MASTACGSLLDESELDAGAGTRRASNGPAEQASTATANDSITGGTEAATADAAAPRTAAGSVTGPAGRTAGGGGGTGGPSAPAGEIVIGSFGTGTGIIGAQLASAPVAIRAWVAAANAAGGIAGRRIRAVRADDGGDPGRALAVVKRMVEQDHVVAFVGTYASTTLHAVLPYLEERGVPVIGNTGSPADDQSPVVFNPQASNLGLHRSLITTLKAQSPVRRIAFLYCRESKTCEVASQRVRAYAPQQGYELVYEAAVSLAQPDYTAEVIAARNAEAEAVVMFIDLNSTIRIIRSAHRQGWRPLFAGGAGLHEDAFKQAGADGEGVLASSSTLPYYAPKMAPYRDAVRDHVPGGQIGGVGAMTWAGGELFRRAVARIDGPPTSKGLLDALHSLTNEDLGGLVPPLTFPRGPHGEVNLCTVPVKFTGGQWTAPLGDRFVCGT